MLYLPPYCGADFGHFSYRFVQAALVAPPETEQEDGAFFYLRKCVK